MTVLLRLVLVLIVVAGSVVMAPARGQMAGMAAITICADGGPRTVLLDARGHPAPPHRMCPDCLPGLTFGPAPQAAQSRRPEASRPVVLAPPRPVAIAGLAPVPAAARDPPRSV